MEWGQSHKRAQGVLVRALFFRGWLSSSPVREWWSIPAPLFVSRLNLQDNVYGSRRQATDLGAKHAKNDTLVPMVKKKHTQIGAVNDRAKHYWH